MKSNSGNKAINNQEIMTSNESAISKKVWQTPAVEIISIASGDVSRGIEGASTPDHNFTPARAATRYNVS